MIRYRRKTDGFTLVELMLAMAFVGALLVAIAMTTMQIIGTYTKGLTMREVNQVGRTITEDLQRTIAASTPFEVRSIKTGAASDSIDSRYVRMPGGGRLCTGAYTYAWNYGETKELDGMSTTKAYNVYDDSKAGVVRFVKVSDAGGKLCVDSASSKIPVASAKELLSAGDRNLAVQKFTIKESARDEMSGQAMYAITLFLGTNNSKGMAVLNPSSTRCLAPKKVSGSTDEASDNSNFCAINEFNIIARAGNRSGSL